MEARELRELGVPELTTKVTQWKEELFRSKLKKFSGEAGDTTASRKLRRDIARALTVLNEKKVGKESPKAEK
ncbi:50S ribosomal protein L29 [bacterium]|nr:50S ribosomal protein L29 [bacterium]